MVCFFFKQKTAYEMRISDWSSDVCSSDLPDIDNLYARIGSGSPHFCFAGHTDVVPVGDVDAWTVDPFGGEIRNGQLFGRGAADMKGSIASFVAAASRSEEHTSELQSLMRISYAVFCLKKKKK